MKKLRNKIFYTVFGILSFAFFIFLFIFNIQNYSEQSSIIRRNLSFNGLIQRNIPFNDTNMPEQANQDNQTSRNNRNIRFMDANAMTVILDENDDIVNIKNNEHLEYDEPNLQKRNTGNSPNLCLNERQ